MLVLNSIVVAATLPNSCFKLSFLLQYCVRFKCKDRGRSFWFNNSKSEVCRASSFAILSVAALALEWAHCWSPKCVRNIQTASHLQYVFLMFSQFFSVPFTKFNFQTCIADIFSELRTTEALWKPSPWSLRQRCLTQWWNHTMHLESRWYVWGIVNLFFPALPAFSRFIVAVLDPFQGSLELPSAGGELWWVFLVGQWSIIRYLLPHFEADYPNLWWPEPFGVCCHERCHLLLAFPWPAELRLAQDCREPGAFPTSALLHDWLCTIDLSWLPAVSRIDSSRVDPAETGCNLSSPLFSYFLK